MEETKKGVFTPHRIHPPLETRRPPSLLELIRYTKHAACRTPQSTPPRQRHTVWLYTQSTAHTNPQITNMPNTHTATNTARTTPGHTRRARDPSACPSARLGPALDAPGEQPGPTSMHPLQTASPPPSALHQAPSTKRHPIRPSAPRSRSRRIGSLCQRCGWRTCSCSCSRRCRRAA